MVKLLQVGSSAASIIKEVEYVPSWNEVLDKPTTFSPTTHTHSNIETVPITNFDDVPQGVGGFYESNQGSASNTPLVSQWHHLIAAVHTNLSTGYRYALQICSPFFSQRLFFRNIIASKPQSWFEILHTGNYVEAWQTPNLSSNFVTGLGGHQVFKFRKNFVNNAIEFIGCVVSNVAFTNGTSYLIATLPVGYRPAVIRRFSGVQGNSAGLGNSWAVTIDSNGNMTVTANGNTVAGNTVVWLEFSMPLV